MNCFHFFSSKYILTNHRKIYLEINGNKGAKMFKEGSTAQFGKYQKHFPPPFVIYANFIFSLKIVKNLIEIMLMYHSLRNIKSILVAVMVIK